MDRRFFLKLIGLASAAPAIAKAAVEAQVPQLPSATYAGKVLTTDSAGNLSWLAPPTKDTDVATKSYVDKQSEWFVFHDYLVQDQNGICGRIRWRNPLPACVLYNAKYIADLTYERVLKNRDTSVHMPMKEGFLLPEAEPVHRTDDVALMSTIIGFRDRASGFYVGL